MAILPLGKIDFKKNIVTLKTKRDFFFNTMPASQPIRRYNNYENKCTLDHSQIHKIKNGYNEGRNREFNNNS